MQGASRESLAAAGERLSALLGQPSSDSSQIGDELFTVVDLLDQQPAVRASLTDPSRDGDDKAALASALLTGKLSAAVVDFVEGTVRSRWAASRDLADTLDRLAAESLLTSADRQGRLDDLEDELFRFSRLVTAEPSLRAALTDRALPNDRKADVVESLLEGKTTPETVRLAKRTVTHPRGRSFEAGLAALADLAANRRRRRVATVTAAVPLTERQREQLSASLARQFGQEIHLNVVVDPQVIGGLRIMLGDELIDGTLINRLDEARRRIAG